MKKGVLIIGLVLIVVLFLSVNLVSAGLIDWFKDLFNIGQDKNLGGGLATLAPGVQGLVAHYSFENNVLDLSGNGNHGVNNGAIFVDGKSGKALKFDGNDYATLVGSNVLMPDPKSWTISAWFKPGSITSSTGSGGNRIITFHRGSTRTAVSLMVGSGNKAKVCYSNNAGGGGDTCTPILSATISANTWYFFTATYDGANVRMYIDNNVPVIVSETISPTPSLDKAFIGRGEDSGSYYFNGTIDEVKIWNYALSADEIKQEYGPVVPPCTPESNVTFCMRLIKNCESVTANDNCGVSRTVNCGSCLSGQTCTNGTCVSQMCTDRWICQDAMNKVRQHGDCSLEAMCKT